MCSSFRVSDYVFSVKFRVNPWQMLLLILGFISVSLLLPFLLLISVKFRVNPWQMLLLPSVLIRGYFFTKKTNCALYFNNNLNSIIKTVRVGLGRLGKTGRNFGPSLLTAYIYGLAYRVT
jgi:hypothetical protein